MENEKTFLYLQIYIYIYIFYYIYRYIIFLTIDKIKSEIQYANILIINSYEFIDLLRNIFT